MAQDPKNLFANIGAVPSDVASGDSAATLAKYTAAAADQKSAIAVQELAKSQADVNSELDTAMARLSALKNNEGDFDLQEIIDGRFTNKAQYAETEITRRSATPQNLDSISRFGATPRKIVEMFIDSAATKATGNVRFEVAGVLDVATGVADDISNDGNVKAQEINEKATKMIQDWGEHKQLLDLLFKHLFNQVLNRVIGYQGRLRNVCNDLDKKSVVLDGVAASLRARQQMVNDDLLETCINGIALQSHIDDAQTELRKLQDKLAKSVGSARGIINEQIKEQEGFIQVMIKRLVDLKGVVVQEIGLYSMLGTIRVSIAVIQADVTFTGNNLIAALGLMLGMVVDIISALRMAKSTTDVRKAAYKATQAVGNATNTIQDVTNAQLVEIKMAMDSLEITTAATVRGIKNTHENMEKVAAMQRGANVRFGQMMTEMGNA